ncbi:MAG: chromosomal replication initiator protein DnaA [Chitinispirillia bacterium]|jgi:chromosomal replication initiator protein
MLITHELLDKKNSYIWEQCLEIIENKIGSHSFETWFKATFFSYTPKGEPCIEVPNQFFADFIEEHFSELIKKSLFENGINASQLCFKAREKNWEKIEPISDQIVNQRINEVPKKVINAYCFHPEYTFEKFVVGDSNRFAHAPCLAVAEAPGKTSFNPLTIYGKTGLGKTHLLQAIGHFAQTESTAENIIYMTSQEFINQYINYVRYKKDSTSFYKKFSNVELLLIDDIHFFSGKPSTQKEFFRIFNNLLMQNKQIVLSSDRPPEKIPDMMEHIINRFLGGLITDIQPPNFETRIAILKKKAEIDGISLPDEVIQYIASHITSNVRELEGTLIKIIASASFTGNDITISAVQEIFDDVLSRKTHRLTVQIIQNKVAEYFKISSHQLRAHTRIRNVTYPRNIAMYLCKKWTKQALRTIGLDFGGRDYSTVIHACKKIEKEMQNDQELAKHIQSIEEILQPMV